MNEPENPKQQSEAKRAGPPPVTQHSLMVDLRAILRKAGAINWIIALIILFVILALLVQLLAPDSPAAAWCRQIIDAGSTGNTLAAVVANVLRGLLLGAIAYTIEQLARHSAARILSRTRGGKSYVNIVDGVIKYAGTIAIIIIILNTLGVNTTGLWASVGIVGLITGLACQPIIADIVQGVFIIFEDMFRVGEIVVIDGFRGKVREIGIRSVKLISANGDIKTISNSDIKGCVNISRKLSSAVIACTVPDGTDPEQLEALIRANLQGLRDRIPAIVAGPGCLGASKLGDLPLQIKLVARCREEDRLSVERDLCVELKRLFDRSGLPVPYPQIVLAPRPGEEILPSDAIPPINETKE